MKEANKDVPLGKDFWLGLEQFSEKFAELIVRECAAIDWRSRLPILQHFGVEE